MIVRKWAAVAALTAATGCEAIVGTTMLGTASAAGASMANLAFRHVAGQSPPCGAPISANRAQIDRPSADRGGSAVSQRTRPSSQYPPRSTRLGLLCGASNPRERDIYGSPRLGEAGEGRAAHRSERRCGWQSDKIEVATRGGLGPPRREDTSGAGFRRHVCRRPWASKFSRALIGS